VKKKFKIRMLKEDTSAAYSDTDSKVAISNGSMEQTLPSVAK